MLPFHSLHRSCGPWASSLPLALMLHTLMAKPLLTFWGEDKEVSEWVGCKPFSRCCDLYTSSVFSAWSPQEALSTCDLHLFQLPSLEHGWEAGSGAWRESASDNGCWEACLPRRQHSWSSRDGLRVFPLPGLRRMLSEGCSFSGSNNFSLAVQSPRF